MVLPIAAVVLAMTAGQADAPPGARSSAAAEEPSEPRALPESWGFLEGSGLSGIPYMPFSGDLASSHLRGLFLDLALQSSLRVQTLRLPDAETTLGSDLEVVPGIALAVQTPTLTFSAGYAPRFTMPFRTGVPALAILSRATLHLSWQPDSLWVLAASGTFTWGDYSQLAPATAPGGPGPPPTTLDPVRSFETYPYVAIDTLVTAQKTISPRDRIRVGAGYFDVGGVGALGQASQPRTWGPLADASYAREASTSATLTTGATFQQWFFIDAQGVVLVTLTESWRQAWTSDLETTLSAGPGFSNREVSGPTGAHQIVPVGSFRLDYRPISRQPFVLSLSAVVAPYVDTYLQAPSEQVAVRGSLDWRPSDAWQVGASVSVALGSNAPSSPGSYGTAGISASFAVTRYLILSAGGYSQAQFPSQASGVTAFWEWSGYFSVAVRDRFSL